MLGKDEIWPVNFIIECMAIGIRCSSLHSSETRTLIMLFYITETCSFLVRLNKVLCIDGWFYLLLRTDTDTTESQGLKPL